MESRAERIGDALILHLEGRMTAGGCDERLPDRVKRMVGEGARRLVLDLQRVSYMDSTCLGEILAASKSLRRIGGRLELVNVPARVQRLLDLSHVGGLLVERSLSPGYEPRPAHGSPA